MNASANRRQQLPNSDPGEGKRRPLQWLLTAAGFMLDLLFGLIVSAFELFFLFVTLFFYPRQQPIWEILITLVVAASVVSLWAAVSRHYSGRTGFKRPAWRLALLCGLISCLIAALSGVGYFLAEYAVSGHRAILINVWTLAGLSLVAARHIYFVVRAEKLRVMSETSVLEV